MISSKAFFAIELCAFLASQHSGSYVNTSVLSRQLGLSVSHVENILKSLRENQLVMAMKGPGGGYALQGDAADVSIWDIASVFETTLAKSSGVADATQQNITPKVPAETTALATPADYEFELERVVKDTLQQHSLADFVDTHLSAPLDGARSVDRFKLKPMPPAFIPKAPNSVFQWHQQF